MPRVPGPVRDGRIVLRVDPELVDAMNAAADDRFEGNRSMLIRQAIREMLDRHAETDREGSHESTD